MSRGRHGQVHCTVQIMESPAKKEHDKRAFVLRAGGVCCRAYSGRCVER